MPYLPEALYTLASSNTLQTQPQIPAPWLRPDSEVFQTPAFIYSLPSAYKAGPNAPPVWPGSPCGTSPTELALESQGGKLAWSSVHLNFVVLLLPLLSVG